MADGPRDPDAGVPRHRSACCAPGHYWVPMWNKAGHTVAYWDLFGRNRSGPPSTASTSSPRGGTTRSGPRRRRHRRYDTHGFGLMAAYVARRLLLMIPTIVGVVFISFVISNFVPGGPVETHGGADPGRGRRRGPGVAAAPAPRLATPARVGCRGSIPASSRETREAVRPTTNRAPERFCKLLLKSLFATFDLRSLVCSRASRCRRSSAEKLPVSISLGVWMTLLSYLISIPLGIRKAVRDGSTLRSRHLARRLDQASPIPSFLWAVLLVDAVLQRPTSRCSRSAA